MQEQLFIAAIIVFAVVSIIYSFYASDKRRKELAAWAMSKDLNFTAEHDSSFQDRYPSFDCLQRGDSRYAYNIMAGNSSAVTIIMRPVQVKAGRSIIFHWSSSKAPYFSNRFLSGRKTSSTSSPNWSASTILTSNLLNSAKSFTSRARIKNGPTI